MSHSILAEWIATAKYAVAFTGAGISTESGIPDFRSPGGVWAKYSPVFYDAFMGSQQSREEYWRQKCEAHPTMAAANPNDGHRILAGWESDGLLRAVITQNIDGLHQQAGSQHVLELHGSARMIQCQDCAHRVAADPLVVEFQETHRVPSCANCGSARMKHATVSFGQSLPEDVFTAACEHCQSCDLILAMGSSLVVTPAADLPRLAKSHGAKLVIINREPTPLDAMADMKVEVSIGEFLAKVDRYRG